jgi:hypothetical protein
VRARKCEGQGEQPAQEKAADPLRVSTSPSYCRWFTKEDKEQAGNIILRGMNFEFSPEDTLRDSCVDSSGTNDISASPEAGVRRFHYYEAVIREARA